MRVSVYIYIHSISIFVFDARWWVLEEKPDCVSLPRRSCEGLAIRANPEFEPWVQRSGCMNMHQTSDFFPCSKEHAQGKEHVQIDSVRDSVLGL